ncbi:hypothetical protein TNCV_2464801 [Trichonephila clavipes]|uniref:Peptidase A2 domain-containing protein n=1 Tax=Trichonephila clavipes TaxID=2585209 RepID=A0A8X6UXC7_TRICX|nr:hypothetical protein TNCV_2464801 [Trichonephila clavipes]
MKEIKREQPNSQVQSCSVTPQKGLHLKSIMLGNEIVSALIDTGSTVSLIREDVSTMIVDHSRLSKINTVLYGLGQTDVVTKGSFEVHPEDELDFSYILDSQVKNDLTRIISLYKPEKTESREISGVHPEDELDFSHILDSSEK